MWSSHFLGFFVKTITDFTIAFVLLLMQIVNASPLIYYNKAYHADFQ